MALLAGCVSAGSAADLTAPRVLSSEPPDEAREVAPSTPLRLRFTEALDPGSAVGAYGAVLIEGIPTAGILSDVQNPPVTRVDPIECIRFLAGEGELVLRPVHPLGAGRVYSLVATRSLRDRAGNRLAGAPRVVSFTTAGADVRLLVPQGSAPTNLAELVLEYVEPPRPAPTPSTVWVVRGDGTPVPVHPAEPRADPRLFGLRLLGRLLAGGVYEVIVERPGGPVALSFAADTEPDLEAPRLAEWGLGAGAAGTQLRVRWSEPCWIRLHSGAHADHLLPSEGGSYGVEHELALVGAATDRLFFRVEARDAAGWTTWYPPLDADPLSAVARPWVRVEIDEVITDAQRDWSDQRCECGAGPGCGEPFDGLPGCDEQTGPADEWVEVVNRSGRTLDLGAGPAPWRLRVLDRTPERADLTPGAVAMWFAPPGSFHAWPDGGRLVIATPGNNNNDARFELVDPWGRVVDGVALGRSGVPEGAASGPEDEAVARGPEGGWCHAAATPGEATGRCAP